MSNLSERARELLEWLRGPAHKVAYQRYAETLESLLAENEKAAGGTGSRVSHSMGIVLVATR